MKKLLPALLIMALILSGCTAKNLAETSASSVDGSISYSAEDSAANVQMPATTAKSESGTASSGSSKATNADGSSAKSGEGGITKESGVTANQSTAKAGSAASGTTKAATTRKATLTTKAAATAKPTTTTTKKSTITCYVTVDWTAAMVYQGERSYLMNSRQVTLSASATAYDALKSACAAQGVSISATNTIYGVYVAGIGGLNEKDHGQYSGWKYMVNGSYPGKSCGKYTLSDGDRITFIYATSL